MIFFSFMWWSRPHHNQGEYNSSITYDTVIDAKNNGFKDRYCLENKSSKCTIDEYKVTMRLLVAGSATNLLHL